MNISCIYPFKKLSEPYLSAVKEYEKRLQRYCKCKFLSQHKKNKTSANSIIYVTANNADAKFISSEQLAEYIEIQGLHGNSDLTFILTDNPLDLEHTISLSYAKLNYEILTVLLSEQIYRGYRIIHHHSYHK